MRRDHLHHQRRARYHLPTATRLDVGATGRRSLTLATGAARHLFRVSHFASGLVAYASLRQVPSPAGRGFVAAWSLL